MNTWKLLGLVAGSVGILFFTTACEGSKQSSSSGGCGQNEQQVPDGGCVGLQSLSKFVGNTKTTAWTYVEGRDIIIDAHNGRVEVKVGPTPGEGRIETTPFVFRAQDTSNEIVREALEGISHDVTGDDDVRVDTGGGGNDGIETVVYLPSNFNGKIAIRQNNGDIDITGVASAVDMEILSDNGACEIQSDVTVQTTSIDCDNGSTAIYGLSNTVDIVAGNGDLMASFDGVGGAGGTLSTGNGDIEVSIPLAAQFSIQATAGQTVDLGDPSGCTIAEAAANSKTVGCGEAGGPNYVVSASSLGSVTVLYR